MASTSRTTIGRRLGVLIAGAVALTAVSVATAGAAILAVLCLIPHSYFLWVVVVTPQVVLFASSSIADVDITDAERLGFTLIGPAHILLASGIAVGLAHYQQAHRPAAAIES